MMNQNPAIIKPPSLRRPLPGSTDNRSTARSNQSTISNPRIVPRKSQTHLRNGNIRNPDRLRKKYTIVNDDGNGLQRQGTTEDDDFYSSLRKQGQQVTQAANMLSKDDREDEFAKLREMAYEARETKQCLLEWRRKIQALEQNLRDQDYAMKEVLSENKALEAKVEKLTRSQMVEANVDMKGQQITLERNKLRRKELHLEKALSASRKENEKLREELASRKSQSNLTDTDEFCSGESKKKQRRKESQLEKQLLATVQEKEELLEEVTSFNIMVQKLEDQNQKLETELVTLTSELDISRRIVHTKRSIMQKEITDETRERMRNEIEKRLNIELTEKLSKEIKSLMREEKEKELKKLREIDEKKVEDVEHQIPVLEDEIDRLRGKIRHAEEYHERTIADIEAHYSKKIETMVNSFSDDRQREEMNFVKRVDELSTQNERLIERVAREKEEHESQIREEVKKEMQKEIEFLANRVSELTKESIEYIEEASKKKELHGEKIREELTKERDELLAEAAKEKEKHGETILQEITQKKNQEITTIKLELEELRKDKDALLEVVEKASVHQELSEERRIELEECNRKLDELTTERDSLLKRVDDVEEKLGELDEVYSKSVKELKSLQSALESSKNEIIKLKKNKRDLNANIKEHKQECEDLSNEVQKIKNHFKYAVLIEYEEKVIELEDEIRNLESVIEQSNQSNTENDEMISNQSSLIEQYKARAKQQEAEIDKIANELKSSLSELESKDLRLAELKDIIAKKESEGDKLLQVIKDLRRSVSTKENELDNLRDERETSRQLEISSQVYREKIDSLNKELSIHKSRLEHCRCDGTPGSMSSSNYKKIDPNNIVHSESKESVDHLQERIGRLNLMLKTAEKNHHKEKLSFEASKNQHSKDMLFCNNEIERLQSDVSRLKKLLDQSQEDLRAVLKKGAGELQIADEIHRLQVENNKSSEKFTRTLAKTNEEHNLFVQEMERLMEELSVERDDLLRKLEAVQKEEYDETKIHMQEKTELKETIQDLKEELNTCNEEKNEIVKELQKSKVLFKEAIISWRGETRDLQKELDHLRQSKRSDTASANNLNYSDNAEHRGDSELIRNSSVPPDSSFFPSVTQSMLQRQDRGQHYYYQSQGNESKSGIHSLSPLFSISEDGDSEMEMSYKSASDHPPSIENIDSELRDEESEMQDTEGEEKSRSDVFSKRLEISEHTTSIEMKFETNSHRQPDSDSASAVQSNVQLFHDEYQRYLGGSAAGVAAKQKLGKPGAGESPSVPESRISRAPQPHDVESEESQNARKADARDDTLDANRSASSRDPGILASEQQQHQQEPDSPESFGGNGGELGDMRRVLQQQMKGLRPVKTASGRKSGMDFFAMTRKVAAQYQVMQMQPRHNIVGAPRNSVPHNHRPKTTFSEMKQHRVPASPFDEPLDRRDTLPFDEHSWME